MTPEQAGNIISWWEGQSFPGKELFKIEENGAIVLCAKPLIRERTIATVTPESADMVLRNLLEKFNNVLSRVREVEVEWLATEDKLKLTDKIANLKDFLDHTNAAGDFEKPLLLIEDWEKALKGLEEENYKTKLQIAEIAESLAESTLWKETAQAFKEIADKWKHTGYLDKTRNDKLWNRIETARKLFHDRKRNHHDDEEKDFLQNLDLKIELAEQAEALANSENWKSATEAYQKITETWKSIGRTLPRKNEELWQRIMTAKNVFFDRKKAHYNIVQAEQEVAYGLKLAIVEKAEAIKESTEWNNTAMAYGNLMEEWKKAGRLTSDKGDELWKRFTAAQEQFFSARKEYLDNMRAVHDANYKLKAALVKRAEEIKNSSRWGEVTVEMNHLFDEWKKIGPVAKEHHHAIWESFLAARKHFFNRKDASRDQRRVQADAHKSARIEQAHAVVYKMQEEISHEEEKLADFKNALSNITPGKKAGQLRDHLEVLIADCNAKLKRLHEKLEAGKDELAYIEEKEKEEKEREAKREAETKTAEAKATKNKADQPKEKKTEEQPAVQAADVPNVAAQAVVVNEIEAPAPEASIEAPAVEAAIEQSEPETTAPVAEAPTPVVNEEIAAEPVTELHSPVAEAAPEVEPATAEATPAEVITEPVVEATTEVNNEPVAIATESATVNEVSAETQEAVATAEPAAEEATVNEVNA